MGGSSIMGNAGRVLLIPKGDYSSGTQYSPMDVVLYEGDSYVCKQLSTGNAPTDTTYWQAMTDAMGAVDELKEALTNEANARITAVVNEASARENADTALGARIDQIIAPSGEAPSAAEVTDARIGDDGITYTSLGDAIRDQFSSVKEHVFECANEVQATIESFKISSASIASNGVIESDSSNDLYVFDVSSIDKIVAKSGQLYGFYIGKPSMGSRSISSQRFIQTLKMDIVDIPSNANYIAIRVPNTYSPVQVFSYSANMKKIDKNISDYRIYEDYLENVGNLLDTELFEYGYIYDYRTGEKTATVNECASGKIIVDDDTSYTFSPDYAYHVCYYDARDNFLGGEVPSQLTIKTPKYCAYMRVSGGKSSMNRLMLAKGTIEPTLTPFGLYSKIPTFDTNNYILPFVKNMRVCCNKERDNATAYYAGVDVNGKPTDIICKFIWEKAFSTSGGKIAIISNPNGLSKISDITYVSLHLTLSIDYLRVSVLGNKYGQYYYDDLIQTSLSNPMVADGETENTVSINIDNGVVTVKVNSETFVGTYDGQASFDEVYGRYVTFEHYCGGDRDKISMPMITYFEVYGDDCLHVKDTFKREDGLLNNTPQGIPYHLISQNFNFDS